MWHFTVVGAKSDRKDSKQVLTREEQLLAIEVLWDVYEALPFEIRDSITHVDVSWKEPEMGCGYDLIFCFKGMVFLEGGWYARSPMLIRPIKTPEQGKAFARGVVRCLAERWEEAACQEQVRMERHVNAATRILHAPEYQDVCRVGR